MTVRLASEMNLAEPDIERSILGSLIVNEGVFGSLAGEMRPEWFSDDFARYIFEAMTRIHAEHGRVASKAVLAALPEDCAGVRRSELLSRICADGLPANMVPSLIGTLRDRWARRTIIDSAENMKVLAGRFDADPYEVAQDTVLALDAISAAKASRRTGSLSSAAISLIQSLDQPQALRGATTGIQALDNKLNGYKAGQLYVLAGRPGMGKSAFMCSSLRRTAEAGFGVGVYSLEMGEDEISARILSDTMDDVNAPAFGAILKGHLRAGDKDRLLDASDTLSSLPLHIDASPRMTFSEIAGRARQLKARLEAEGRFLAVLCIDHMGLVTPSDRYRGNKVAEAGEVSAQARALAKEMDCCVLLLCQLSREVEKRDDKRPIMADLRWSGEIEQDAHVVAFLYREAYYLAQDAGADPFQLSSARFKLDFLIRKNRNGETGDVRLWCSIAHSSVRDEI